MDWEKSITFGLFLILFGWWINPVINKSRDKNQSIRYLTTFFCLFLFLCPLVAQADDADLTLQEEIAEVPSPDSMSEEAISYLLGEDMYQGTLSWQGNKVSTKFNYDMNKEK